MPPRKQAASASSAASLPQLADFSIDTLSSAFDAHPLVDMYAGWTPIQQTLFWRQLSPAFPAVLNDVRMCDPTSIPSSSPSRRVLGQILLLLDHHVSLPDPNLNSASLQPIVGHLHADLVQLPAPDQHQALAVIESWYLKRLPDHALLAPNLFCLLLLLCLSPTPKPSDYKRLFSVRDALSLLDLEDASARSLRTLLLRAFMSEPFSRAADGKRFLSHVLATTPLLVADAYAAVRNQIPAASKPYLAAVGDILYRAWADAATPAARQTLEYSLFQDLMHRAVHAQPTGAFITMAGRLRKVLGGLHAKKAEAGVDEMLCRLYEPVLWRAMRVANPVVRRNAAALFSDVFPLQNVEDEERTIDEQMQRQFEAIDVRGKWEGKGRKGEEKGKKRDREEGKSVVVGILDCVFVSMIHDT